MFLGFFQHDTQHHYPQISGLDGLSSIKMTANKYNIRAKRLALDNLIRDREWKAFLISFSQLSSAQGGGGIPIIPGGGGGSGGDEDEEERRPGESTVSLCKAVVICRHHLTAHRMLLHSLCDVPRDTPRPPPPGGGSSHSVGLSPIAAPSRARETESNATPHGDRTRDWHRRNGGAARRDLLLALNSRRQTPLLDAARRGGRRRRR